jgi:magnesium transporter
MSDGEEVIPGGLAELLEREGLDRDTLRECLSNVHPVDLAELLDDVDLEDRVRIFEVLDPDRAAQVLAAMPHDYKVELVDRLGEERLAPVIDRVPDYAVADILDHLPKHRERTLLAKLDEAHAADIHQLTQYDPHTAGGRMTKNFVAVPESFSAGETIKAIQGAVDSHTVEFVYVVDDEGALRGILSLPKLMIHPPEEAVTSFMRRDITFVGPSTDQEEVAKLAQKYRLRHVPVVDNRMKLLGVVTLQDIIDVIRHEANEDIMRMAGAEHVDPVRAPFLRRLKARLPWLGAAMVLELLIAWIMKAYGRTLEELALAYFIPVIMAMGGSLGLQSSTIVVRGLATGDITVPKALRVVVAEFRIGLAIGLMAGIVTGLMALLMHLGVQGSSTLGLIVFISMMASLCIAATMGAFTPLLLQRLRMDPAVASGPFITAVNDVVNVTIYLTVATLLIVKAAPR